MHLLDLLVQARVLDRQRELRADALKQAEVDALKGIGDGARQTEQTEQAGV